MAMNYNAKDEVDLRAPVFSGAPLRPGGQITRLSKQQRLPAWQPILTAGTVLPTFFIIGLIIFIPIGIGIFVTSNNIREIEVSWRGGGGRARWRRGGAVSLLPGVQGSGGPAFPHLLSSSVSLFLFLRVFPEFAVLPALSLAVYPVGE